MSTFSREGHRLFVSAVNGLKAVCIRGRADDECVLILPENLLEFFLQDVFRENGFGVIIHVGTFGNENIDISGNMKFIYDLVDAVSHISVPSKVSCVKNRLSVTFDFEHIRIGGRMTDLKRRDCDVINCNGTPFPVFLDLTDIPLFISGN